MKDIFLISSLGLAPGVITGVIDSLQYNDLGETFNPKYVAIITTDNELTQMSLKIVEEDIQKYNPHIKIISYVMKGLSDIFTIDDNFRVMKTFVAAIREGERLRRKKEIDQIHVNITGGRKTISGIFTTLSNIFPVDMVYHLLTTPDIEQQGIIKNFLNPDNTLNTEKIQSNEFKNILHPKLINAPSILVEIPILHSIDFNELLDIMDRINKNLEISEHYLINMMIRQGFLKSTGYKRYQITEKGKSLFRLFNFYLE